MNSTVYRAMEASIKRSINHVTKGLITPEQYDESITAIESSMTQRCESQEGLPTPRATPLVKLTSDQPVVVNTLHVNPNPVPRVKPTPALRVKTNPAPRVNLTFTQRVNMQICKHMPHAVGNFLRDWQMNVPEDQHDPRAFLQTRVHKFITTSSRISYS